MEELDKQKFVDLVYDNINIIRKICAIYSNRNYEDLQQDIIYQLWKSYPSFKEKSKFQTWMYRVALNTVLLGERKKKIQLTEWNENIENQRSEFEDDISEQVTLLYRHISNLNDVDKAITFLYLENCSYEEISKITGLKVNNVSVRLVRIKEKLRKMFDQTT